VENTDTKSVI